MIKIQTLTLTSLAALLWLGLVSFIMGSWELFGAAPAICILPMLTVGAIAHFKGILVYAENDPYQEKG